MAQFHRVDGQPPRSELRSPPKVLNTALQEVSESFQLR